MKINVSIDPNYPEDLDISIKAKTADPRIKQIENLLGEDEKILGFDEKGFAVLNPEEVYYFATEDGKIYAHLGKKKVLVKKRIYELEAILEKYPDYFLINQGSIANLKKVERMSASLNGSLSLVFLNGEEEYASRIQTSLLKKKLGL
jgi:DNA-binding LytR/AlgR family response regulator